MKIRNFLALIFVLVPCNVLAQSTVPNTFVPGTPANASEVNENFNALAGDLNLLLEYLQQATFSTQRYETNYDYSTSYGYAYSEVAVATCPADEFLLSGSVSCAGDNTNSDLVNNGTVSMSLPSGGSHLGTCVADPFYSTSEYGPGIKVTIICASIIDTPPLGAVSSLKSATATFSMVDEQSPQGEMDDEALEAYEALRTELSAKAALLPQ